MKRNLVLILLAVTALHVSAATPWSSGPLRVSPDGYHFQQADGQPFFWLGDTAWLLTQKLNREEVATYFANRRAKGFNVVQFCVVQFLHDKSIYGSPALVGEDLTRLHVTPGADPGDPAQYDYWDHVDYVVDTAAANGIYVAIAPVWSHMVRRTPLTAAQVGPYIEQVARRYRDRANVIWLNGGSGRGHENPDVWKVIGDTLLRQNAHQLVSFHPFGRIVTTEWFKDAAWLDFHMFTSGHRRYDQDTEGRKYGEDNWRYVLEARAADPKRPVLDAEPAYENTPQGLHNPEEPYWTAADSRRYAYWSVFAGAAGHTYGENSVRQVYIPAETKPASGAKGFIMERLETDGARQMTHLKTLALSRPFFERVNDQSLVAGDEGEKYDRVLVTRGTSYLFAYTYTGRSFTLQPGALTGERLRVSWFNPRTGETTPAGTMAKARSATFDPPGEPAPGNDWVLILDDAARQYPTPATR
ncbi:MAG: glycoside hydrolase family 140 protein [Vicinamibacterales bacterium]|nr:glycoside hydrolase family 140 protein [Vicinamibacterales bacterium]